MEFKPLILQVRKMKPQRAVLVCQEHRVDMEQDQEQDPRPECLPVLREHSLGREAMFAVSCWHLLPTGHVFVRCQAALGWPLELKQKWRWPPSPQAGRLHFLALPKRAISL